MYWVERLICRAPRCLQHVHSQSALIFCTAKANSYETRCLRTLHKAHFVKLGHALSVEYLHYARNWAVGTCRASTAVFICYTVGRKSHLRRHATGERPWKSIEVIDNGHTPYYSLVMLSSKNVSILHRLCISYNTVWNVLCECREHNTRKTVL